ncbi:scavenger receptor cysteine-rich type 1 protein M130-like isoform X2 [Chroicocephalus ridibundus]|uniref:scavenger receptor cysteine-rich type 1 protein M130-like isoform X2 n=1 Tax=Chroicocephalus ridibundus TaxID=1192867 RepID=UPI002FDDDC5E
MPTPGPRRGGVKTTSFLPRGTAAGSVVAPPCAASLREGPGTCHLQALPCAGGLLPPRCLPPGVSRQPPGEGSTAGVGASVLGSLCFAPRHGFGRFWGESCCHWDRARAGLPEQHHPHGGTRAHTPHAGCRCPGWGLGPPSPGDIRAPTHRGEVCDASSGAEPHIWARSRLLEAGAPPAGEITRLITAQTLPPPPLAPGFGVAYISPSPRRGVRDGRMVPIGALGLLLCVWLCGGQHQGRGQPWGSRGAGTPPGRTPGSAPSFAAGAGELRLVGGGGRCAGRVEVKHNGEWGSVCVYDFDWEASWATVVCRQLGCGRVTRASAYAPFGEATGRIWLQPFFCRGNEKKLQDCPHFGWGQHFCDHKRDVGVTCADAVELRLAAGGGPCAGRVEVKLQGRWGSVGDDQWDMEDAEVVCQHLGCGSAAGAHSASGSFGNGEGPLSLALVDCHGDEATFWDCEIRGWGPYAAPHNFDTAVTCQGRSWATVGTRGSAGTSLTVTPAPLPAGFARLVSGDGACAGRLEVRHGRAWVSVCEDAVDMEAARVVCRELGCGQALAVPGTGRFEAGTGPFWEGGFSCTGTEPLLATCARRPAHGQGCAGHASVICSSYTGFRLAGDSSGCAGRVEVEVGGTWGSLCATGWDLPDAHVLCRHLGCGPSAAIVPPGGSFGGGDGPLRPDAFSCGGIERHPGECPTAVLGEPACPPGHAAAVNCSGMAESLRLVEGESRCDGRLEVATSSGAWARVPAGLWDAQRATVVCQQLGCGVPEKVHAVPGSGSAALLGLRCNGSEENLAWCNVSGTATTPTGSPEEVAVVCSGSRRVRLAGGPGRCAGRVEVYVEGTWATICQENWDLLDATVVCRQLGCGTALAAPGSARFGPGTGPLWPEAGGCAGTEASLWDCPALARRGCRRGGGAGAECSEHLSLRLVGGSGLCSGHLEVRYNGTWGRVCAKGTSPATATAVCWQLGCGSGGRLVAAPARAPAPAWLAWVSCKEGTRSLWRCPSAPWRLQACSPGGDAHVTCDGDIEGTSGMTTLSPGSHSPQVCPDVPSSTVATARTVSVLTVLCVVLGTLLGLAVGAVAVQTCRARGWWRGGSRQGVVWGVWGSRGSPAMGRLDPVPPTVPPTRVSAAHRFRPRQSRGRRLGCHLRGAGLRPDARVPGGAQSPRLPVGGVRGKAAVLQRGQRGGA